MCLTQPWSSTAMKTDTSSSFGRSLMENGAPFAAARAPRQVRECRTLRSSFDASSENAGGFRFVTFSTSLMETKDSLLSLEGPQRGKRGGGDGGKTRFCFFSIRLLRRRKTRRKKVKSEKKTVFFLFLFYHTNRFSPLPPSPAPRPLTAPSRTSRSPTSAARSRRSP